MRTGCSNEEPQRSNEAFDEMPDHVDSQLSGVHTRANPTAPMLEAIGSAPHTVPQRRSEGSIVKSKQRRSASVRHTWKIEFMAPRRASPAFGLALLRLLAAIRSAINALAMRSMRSTRAR